MVVVLVLVRWHLFILAAVERVGCLALVRTTALMLLRG